MRGVGATVQAAISRLPGRRIFGAGERAGHRAYIRRRGVVALEFAAITPVLIIMVLGAWDTARALIVWQETLEAAKTIAFSAQALAVQPDLTTDISPQNATLAMTTIYGTMPKIKMGIYTGAYSVTLSSVQFTPVGDGTYTAALLWSVPLTEGNSPPMISSVTRTCGGTITQVAKWPQDQTNLTVIATLLVTLPASTVVADVHYQYTPAFFNFITGKIDFWESYQLPNLSGPQAQLLTYDKINPNDPADCSNQT